MAALPSTSASPTTTAVSDMATRKLMAMAMVTDNYQPKRSRRTPCLVLDRVAPCSHSPPRPCLPSASSTSRRDPRASAPRGRLRPCRRRRGVPALPPPTRRRRTLATSSATREAMRPNSSAWTCDEQAAPEHGVHPRPAHRRERVLAARRPDHHANQRASPVRGFFFDNLIRLCRVPKELSFAVFFGLAPGKDWVTW